LGKTVKMKDAEVKKMVEEFRSNDFHPQLVFLSACYCEMVGNALSNWE
jgi:hypothetical protein